MKYLLDTNIVSYFSDPRSSFHSATIKKFSALAEKDTVFISVLTLYETEYGIVYAPAEKRKRMAEVKSMLQQFLLVLPVSAAGADSFGRIKAGYRKMAGADQKTVDRHDVDFILASSAIAEDAILSATTGSSSRSRLSSPPSSWKTGPNSCSPKTHPSVSRV